MAAKNNESYYGRVIEEVERALLEDDLISPDKVTTVGLVERFMKEKETAKLKELDKAKDEEEEDDEDEVTGAWRADKYKPSELCREHLELDEDALYMAVMVSAKSQLEGCLEGEELPHPVLMLS